jgi:hypothetical protein
MKNEGQPVGANKGGDSMRRGLREAVTAGKQGAAQVTSDNML